MKTDIIQKGDGWAVYPRTAYDGDGYEGDPIYTGECEGDCIEWCEEHAHTYRRRKNVVPIPEKFLRDVEKRFDGWREDLDAAAEACGMRVESNATYHESAAWKEEPTHYCYSGDMGGGARLVEADAAKRDAEAEAEAWALLREIATAAAALWELGITMTYGADGRHRAFGIFPEWVTLDRID